MWRKLWKTLIQISCNVGRREKVHVNRRRKLWRLPKRCFAGRLRRCLLKLSRGRGNAWPNPQGLLLIESGSARYRNIATGTIFPQGRCIFRLLFEIIKMTCTCLLRREYREYKSFLALLLLQKQKQCNVVLYLQTKMQQKILDSSSYILGCSFSYSWRNKASHKTRLQTKK